MYSTNNWLIAYVESMRLVGYAKDHVFPEEVMNRIVLPPVQRRLSGRRRTKRRPSVGETLQTRKCSRCQQYGHNRQTCQNPVPLERPMTSTRRAKA